MFLMDKIYKFGLIALAILLVTTVITVGFFWFQVKAVRAETAKLKIENASLMEAIQAGQAALEAERTERRRVEQLLTKRLALQKQIERQAQEKLEAKNRELAALRKQYETIDAFLSIPVPDEFRDQWMRQADSQN